MKRFILRIRDTDHVIASIFADRWAPSDESGEWNHFWAGTQVVGGANSRYEIIHSGDLAHDPRRQ